MFILICFVFFVCLDVVVLMMVLKCKNFMFCVDFSDFVSVSSDFVVVVNLMFGVERNILFFVGIYVLLVGLMIVFVFGLCWWKYILYFLGMSVVFEKEIVGGILTRRTLFADIAFVGMCGWFKKVYLWYFFMKLLL